MQARTQEHQDQKPDTEQTYPTKRRFDVHEYHRMGEAGVFEGECIELIDGEVVTVSPIGGRHARCVTELIRLMVALVGVDLRVSPQNPVRLDDGNEPEPDVAIIKASDRYRSGELPTLEDILLLVEVSDTTLAYDKDVKLPLYAKFAVPEVWIIDLTGGVIERYTEPSPDGYRLIRKFGKEDNVESAVVAGVSFPAGEVLG